MFDDITSRSTSICKQSYNNLYCRTLGISFTNLQFLVLQFPHCSEDIKLLLNTKVETIIGYELRSGFLELKLTYLREIYWDLD